MFFDIHVHKNIFCIFALYGLILRGGDVVDAHFLTPGGKNFILCMAIPKVFVTPPGMVLQVLLYFKQSQSVLFWGPPPPTLSGILPKMPFSYVPIYLAHVPLILKDSKPQF